MFWKGKELKTYGDIMKDGIDKCDSPEEAKLFMIEYSKENQYARQNIGYMAGYYSREDATRIYEWFSVEHPVFGTKFPTADEAFQAGLKLGKSA